MTTIHDELLTEEQAAKLLGVKAQTLSVWRCTKRYPLPFIRVGRSVRYRKYACEQFLASRTVGATEPAVGPVEVSACH